MGKKKSGHGGEKYYTVEEEEAAAPAPAREFVLKVAMHCRCHGCTMRVRSAVRELTRAGGVEAADISAAESSGEVRLLATADPEKLRRRLSSKTKKKVDLLLPKPAKKQQQQENQHLADAAALQALLAELQLQHAPAPAPAAAARHQYGGGAPWANQLYQQQQQQQVLGACYGGNSGGYGAAYPWLSSASSYYPAPAASVWGTYGYAPQAPAPAHHGNLGYYGGGAPAWLGHGY